MCQPLAVSTSAPRIAVRLLTTVTTSRSSDGKQRGRRSRSTRRRQDAAPLPARKIAPRTTGRVYTAPGGKRYRPSMFITLTCGSYGKVGDDGAPVDPASYDYTRAARDAIHFAALQSPYARTVLGRHGKDPHDLDTVYVAIDVDGPGERLLARSRAILFILGQLGG